MAAYLTAGAGRLNCSQSERRLRSAPKQCLIRCDARCSESTAASSSPAKVILPGLLAAALLHSSVAHAGVVLQQKEGKKFYQGQKRPQAEKPAEASSSGGGGGFSFPSLPTPQFPSISLPGLPKAPSLPGIKAPEVNLSGGDFDLKSLSLPGAIGGIGFIAFAASKIDKGFGQFMNESLVKDSTNYTGYEEDPPQGRGSPKGFLGLGNLYIPALPFGQQTADKLKSVSTPKGSQKSKKGTIAIGKNKKNAKSGSKSGGKGLFGFGK